jgi:hypothetical protein
MGITGEAFHVFAGDQSVTNVTQPQFSGALF